MRRLVLVLAMVLVTSGVATAEFVAQESDFKCLRDGRAVEGKTFFVFHRNKRKLRRALHVARLDRPRKRYPVGTILQLFPFEAMVKRGGRYNPEGDGWEFFRLSVSAAGTQILARGAAEVTNPFGSCQNCHAAASSFDFVCEGHGAPGLPLPPAAIKALQNDARCPPAP